MIYIVLLILGLPFSAGAEDSLHAIGIQWEMEFDYVTDVQQFWKDAEAAIEREYRGEEHTLIVFPEYTSVFLTLTPYESYIREESGIPAAWQRISADFGYEQIADLFTAESAATYKALSGWKELARRYESYIIPGTLFVYDPRQEKLVNRMVLIDPAGEIAYYQDKVYTTHFETSVLRAEGSFLPWAQPFTIGGVNVGVTICRDTFFESWEGEFPDLDLWIDIKANGQEFTAQTGRLFDEAVPERIEDMPGTLGMTVSLTGDFLELFWEGESSVVDHEGRVIAATDHTDRFDTFSVVVTPAGPAVKL